MALKDPAKAAKEANSLGLISVISLLVLEALVVGLTGWIAVRRLAIIFFGLLGGGMGLMDLAYGLSGTKNLVPVSVLFKLMLIAVIEIAALYGSLLGMFKVFRSKEMGDIKNAIAVASLPMTAAFILACVVLAIFGGSLQLALGLSSILLVFGFLISFTMIKEVVYDKTLSPSVNLFALTIGYTAHIAIFMIIASLLF